MLPWIKELREKWPTYGWPLFVALVIGAICGFGAATFWWTGTVATLRERVALLQENRGPTPVTNRRSHQGAVVPGAGR